MTDEERERLSALIAKNKETKKKAEIERIRVQMSAEIENFSQRYEFADIETSEQIGAFIDGLPYRRPAWVDLEKFPNRRGYSANESDYKNVWICFLLGNEELFKIFVGCKAADFFADFDEWTFYSPYIVLLYSDFSGFVFIDDNEEMTEVIP